MLDVRNVSVWLDRRQVLSDVSLAVEAGEVCAVLGPSGCGKSTLLRTIAGLVTPVTGVVYLDGADMADVAVEHRGVGLMFQEHALFPHLNVAENVAFGLRMQQVRGDERDSRVADALKLVGLSGLASRRITQLSGGERQRVALARTLAPQPRLVLLDEPLGALDRSLRDHLLDELPEIFARTNTTAVYVTHDHGEAEQIAVRMAVMATGRIDRHDTPAALWREPMSVFTARFLHLGPVWERHDDAYQVSSPFGAFGDRQTRGVLMPNAALSLGEPSAGTDVGADASVTRIVFQAGRRYAQIRFGDQARATVACDDRQVVAGMQVRVKCPRERVTVLSR